MKTIQLLHSAAIISSIVAKEDLHHHHSYSYSHSHIRHLQIQNITCDTSSGETPCHDEIGTVISCAQPGKLCPCTGNQQKCTDPHYGSEYCDTVCCEWDTQERCHAASVDYPNQWEVWCADVSDGGCPCFDGEVKCGITEGSPTDGGHPGHCASLCCEANEQTCYDENYDPSYCAALIEGGCPCAQGQEKCGGDGEDWAGYCTDVCCDVEFEETCYDYEGNKSCSRISQGGCSHGESYEHWKSRVASTILAEGLSSQVAYYHSIKNRKGKLLVEEDSSLERQNAMKHLEAEVAALFHAVRLGRKKKLANEEVFTSFH